MNTIEQLVIEKLKTINDLELPVSIYELGLIYKTEIENVEGKVHVNLEMTTINSSYSDQKSITYLINSAITSIKQIDKCNIKFVFTPKWELSMVSKKGLETLRNSHSLNYQM